MVLLNRLGFSNVQAGRHGFANFSLFGNRYEVIRYEHEVCLGQLVPIETYYEIFGYLIAMEDILVDYPKLQGFYSHPDNAFKLRIWLPCENGDQLGATLRLGIETLSSMRAKAEEWMLAYTYAYVESMFENVIATENDDDEY